MKWDEFARQLTDVASGSGRCVFAAIHSAEDGTCLGRYPKDGQQVKVNEIMHIKKAFRDPTILYSSGITLKDTRFTYVKVEKNVLLGRTTHLACLIMQTDKVYIICVYPGDELTKNVYYNCESVNERIRNSS
ncbi:uncharacterized protein TNCT_178711 [Trichonephila clavata]|uniref:Profilin n=1 Tax=Trichonephila clavata TaxID=2740835 RepID=A0A8X6KU54_TRICU|nr:uncharacterized protein TNCT_178711 [Trichonephila clavata]